MNVNNIYKGLFELATAPQEAGEAAMSMSGAARRELLLVAKKEECLPNLYLQWDAAGLLSPTESGEHEQFQRKRKSALEVVQALPDGVLLLGGLGVRRHYPSGVKRLWADFDVLVSDLAAIGPLHEVLKRFGYRLREAGDWRVPPRGPLHRVFASYSYASSGAQDAAVCIGVHVTGVPVDAQHDIAFAEFTEKTVRIEGLSCLALEPTRQVLALLADVGARVAPVTVRQVVDLHLVLKANAGKIDHAWLRKRVDQWNLWGALDKLREAIVSKRLSTLLDWGELGQMIGASAGKAAAPSGARQRDWGSGKKGAAAPGGGRVAAFVKNSFELFGGQRDNDLASKAGRSPWLVSAVLGAGHRVLGVPVSTKTHAAPQLLRMDGGLYVATGAGLFLLSLVDLSDTGRAAVAESLRSASRPTVLARWTGAAPAPSRERREKREKREAREKRDLRDMREARPSRG